MIAIASGNWYELSGPAIAGALLLSIPSSFIFRFIVDPEEIDDEEIDEK